MRQTTARVVVVAAVLAVVSGGPAKAAEPYTFTVSLLGGLGGSLESEADTGLANSGWQLGLGMVTEARTHLVLRLGAVDFDEGRVDGLADAELSYATVGGEYRALRSWYDSGIFLGLGAYDLDGVGGGGDTAIGITLGATGDFQIRGPWSLVVELSGHWVDFDETQLFGFGHVGVALHF
ncbi:MAG TPA: hypothetical protein VMT16_05755 [Thermoanaerobaculia bacterium]|nr:hypothetical protein [Thermoanaerobaculia bacterium]